MLRRLLTRLLILGLCPVLILSIPDVASAAVSVGPTATFEFDMGQFSAVNATCSGNGRFERDGATNPTVVGKIQCSLGFMVESVTIGLSASGAGGCAFDLMPRATYNAPGMTDDTGPSAFVLRLNPITAPLFDPATCTIDQLCWDASVDREADGDSDATENYAEGCIAWPIGPVPAVKVTSECSLGNPKSAPVQTYIDFPDSYPDTPNDWQVKTELPLVWKTKDHDANPTTPERYVAASTGKWLLEQVFRDKREGVGPLQVGTMVQGSGGTVATTRAATDPPTNTTQQIKMNTPVVSGYNYGGPGSWELVGYQLSWQGTPAPTSAGVTVQNWSQNRVLPQSGTNGNLGLTDPTRCLWYWGTKIASTPTDDFDQPAGPVDGSAWPPTGGGGEVVDPLPDPPVPPDSGCGSFSLLNPSTWATGGLCAIAQILGQIWGVLKSVLKAITSLATTIADAIADALAGIVGAIGDLLQSLFVPTRGVFGDGMDEIREAFADSTIGNYVDGLGGLTPPSAGGGCDGPAVTIPVPGNDGAAFYPLSACGNLSYLAGLARAFLTVSFGIGGVYGCLRALGSGFGWKPGVGGDA